MASKTYRDTAIILSSRPFSEADRVVDLFTHSGGRVSALAKGVRRTRSKFGARLEPFMHVDVQCHIGKTFHYVTQAELIGGYGSMLAASPEAYTAAHTVSEAVRGLVPEQGEPAPELFALALGAISAIARGRVLPDDAADSFLLRALAGAGYALALDGCALCGSEGTHAKISVPAGGLVCSECHEPSATSITTEAVHTLLALEQGNWEYLTSVATLDRRAAAGVVQKAARWHIDAPLRSLHTTLSV